MILQDYDREGRALYRDFAAAVASIVSAAIGEADGYKLQQMQSRAKSINSLQQKLARRKLATDSDVTELKDLAGCRAIFYTNTDVEKFLNSGLVEANFDVVDRILHYPHRQAADAAELYVANHYVLRLTEARAALPEYRQFTGLKCELQIQTILNHSWAATAHDTIYKTPELERFGTEALKRIETRLARIAKKYLVPAGYEFDRVFHDFERILAGKALLDDDALATIVRAPDNNARLMALETFSTNVLPLYDEINAVLPEIARTLIEAAEVSKRTEPIGRETPFGTLRPTTFAEILNKIQEILRPCRYVDIELTFSILRRLWPLAESDDERKPLNSLADSLAKHDLTIWKKFGPAAQRVLVDAIGALPREDLFGIAPLVARLLSGVLRSDVEGTTSTSSTVTIQTGSTTASPTLEAIRSKALDILDDLVPYDLSRSDRAAVQDALLAATNPPHQGAYGRELALIVLADTKRVLEILTRQFGTLPSDERQSLEARVFRIFRMNSGLRTDLQSHQPLVDLQLEVRKTALALRDAANADPEFDLYKVLVGYQSVYPDAWRRDDLDWRADQAYREDRSKALLTSVNAENADEWFVRLSGFATTDSRDSATFPVVADFIRQIGEQQPNIVFEWLGREGAILEKFLPGMLSGLMRTDRRADTEHVMNLWVDSGKKLRGVSWYLRFADPFDEPLLKRTLQKAVEQEDIVTICSSIDAAVRQFEKQSGDLIVGVFIPAIQAMREHHDTRWLNSSMTPWMEAPLLTALAESQARIVLDALIPYPNLESDAEEIVSAIGQQWPEQVLDFLSARITHKRSEEAAENYDAIPFQVHELREPLAANAELLIETARKWYHEEPYTFQYDGGRLLYCVFPELSGGLANKLESLVDDDPDFVLAVLSAYEGNAVIYETVRKVLRHAEPQSPVIEQAHGALDQSGVVMGEFGFADLHDERRHLLTAWLDDESQTVRDFAKDHLAYLERRILSETKRAEAGIAARRLAFDEEPIVEEQSDSTEEEAEPTPQ